MRKFTAMVSQTHNFYPREDETRGLTLFCGQPGIPNVFHFSLGYRMKGLSKKKKHPKTGVVVNTRILGFGGYGHEDQQFNVIFSYIE